MMLTLTGLGNKNVIRREIKCLLSRLSIIGVKAIFWPRLRGFWLSKQLSEAEFPITLFFDCLNFGQKSLIFASLFFNQTLMNGVFKPRISAIMLTFIRLNLHTCYKMNAFAHDHCIRAKSWECYYILSFYGFGIGAHKVVFSYTCYWNKDLQGVTYGLQMNNHLIFKQIHLCGV